MPMVDLRNLSARDSWTSELKRRINPKTIYGEFLCSMLVSLVALFAIANCSSQNAYKDSIKCEGEWCIRIKMEPILLSEYRFVVESKPKDSEKWTLVLEHLQEEPITHRNAQIHFLSDKFAYFWLGTNVGISDNGGHSWRVTDFKKESVHSKKYFLLDIKTVIIRSNGSGEVVFRDHDLVAKQPWFTTEDFGQTWKEHRTTLN